MAGALISLRRPMFGVDVRNIIKPSVSPVQNSDRMGMYHDCKARMIKPFRGCRSNFVDGDRVLLLSDIDVDFIESLGENFYWNFFDGLFVDTNVAKWAGNRIDIDKLQFNENNAECLSYLYPKLTSRARLYGGKVLACVLRSYKIRYYLDKEKLACQLFGMSDKFAEEFGITPDMTKPMADDTTIGHNETLRVVTSRNIETVTDYLKVRFANDYGFCLKECLDDGTCNRSTIGAVLVVKTDNSIGIYCDGKHCTDIVPGDCINIETKKNTYIIKSALNGSLSHFLKLSTIGGEDV